MQGGEDGTVARGVADIEGETISRGKATQGKQSMDCKDCKESTSRNGPSGQPLRGPQQKSTVIDAPPVESENPLRTPSIEAENVHRVYDNIADNWDSTRYKAWPRVDAFIRELPRGSLVADVGCGNGKNVPAIQDAGGFAVPSDMSAPLVRITMEKHGVSGLVADCLCTPFRSGSFDAVISIAVLHHISTEARRIQALREAARLLKPGGRFLAYCWAFEQDADVSRSRHRFGGQDVFVPFHHRQPGVKKPRAGTDSKGPRDASCEPGEGAAEPAAQWQEEPPVFQRYCHVYRDGELQGLFAHVPELEVQEIYHDAGNWCSIAIRRPA